MGPGRLTGMNACAAEIPLCSPMGFNGARSIDRDERVMSTDAPVGGMDPASMGPGRLTGMNDPQQRHQRAARGASMGPGRLTGMNVPVLWRPRIQG